MQSAKRARTMDLPPQSGADSARAGLMAVNNLNFALKPDLSVCVARSMKNHFFTTDTYNPGQRMICLLNSGSELVRAKTSALSFDIENTSGKTMWLGVGSIMNCFKESIITTRSGDEIERINNINRLSPILEKMTCSDEFINANGELWGMSTTKFGEMYAQPTGSTGLGNWNDEQTTQLSNGIDRDELNHTVVLHDGQTRRFWIPLGCFSGLFREFDQLLPSSFCSGLRIELEIAAAGIPFFASDLSKQTSRYVDGSGGTATEYASGAASWQIQNPRIILDSYQLTDSVMRVLNEESGLRGLELVFPTWYNTSYPVSGTTANIEIRKAVSRALSVTAIIHENNSSFLAWDSMQSAPWDVIEWQMRLGSLYFPQQVVKGATSLETSAETYFHLAKTYGKWLNKSSPPSLSYNQFASSWQEVGTQAQRQVIQTYMRIQEADLTRWVVPLNAIAVDLERSNVQKYTGLPINNSRVAELRLKFAQSRTCVVDVYLKYVRLVRVFLQNTEIEE